MFEDTALQRIQQTAVKASGNRIHKPGAEPDHVYLTEDVNGNLTRQIAVPKPVNHGPTDFRSVVALAHAAGQLQTDSVTSEQTFEPVTLWCSLAGVVAVLSADRRDRANLKLTKSGPFAELCRWANSGVGGVAVDHVTAYTLFRTLFRAALPAHPTIRDDIRKVDIGKAQQASSDVSRTAVSMSKKLIAEASGADRLPEVLTFSVPVFAEAIAPIKVLVEVAFDLDPQQEKFRFIVLPNQIETAVAEAEEWIERQVASLNEGKIPVYRGEP